MNNKSKIIGSFVKVTFPEFGLGKVTAKIDTGAYTGALHCTKIHEENENKTKVLYFSPFDHPETTKSTDKYFVKYVKSSNGSREKRFVIDTVIKLDDETYPIFLTLADRSDMDFPVLIGRRFLGKYNFLVDVNVGTRYREPKRNEL